MTASPVRRVLDALGATGCNPTQSGDGWSAHCPAHDDRNPSLSVTTKLDGHALVHCHAGCPIDDVLDALGLASRDLFDADMKKNHGKLDIVATYDYVDEAGVLLYQVCRLVPKSFRQRRPDGRGGWKWNLKGTHRVPYRLPEVIAGVAAGRWIVVAEGEKDCDRLRSVGFVATCNAGGAGKFSPDFARYFASAKVVVIPDNDTPGRAHGEQVAGVLHHVASDLRVVALPGLADHGDLSDWLNDGGSAEELKRLILGGAPTWEPQERVAKDHRDGVDDDPERRVLRLIPVAAIAAQCTKWAWRDRIPLGGACLIAGQEGAGKTTILADVLARASLGQLDGDLYGKPVGAVYATAEDSWARTLRPRLEAAGADLDLVHFVEIDGLAGGLTIPGDLDSLVAEMRRVLALLLVLDPLGAHLHGTLDTHRDASVRQAMAPLAARMDELGAAAVGVMHWSKAPTTVALDRVNGSRGFTAAARAVLAVGDDPEDAGTHVLVVAKSNLGRLDVPALRYQIEGRTVTGKDGELIDTSGVVWLGEAPGVTARDLFAAPADEDERSDREAVDDVIRETLANGHEERRAEVLKAVRASGLDVSDKTFQRECRRLGVVRRRLGFGSGASFVLALPTHDIPGMVDNAPMTQRAVHYVQNGADQDFSEGDPPIVDNRTGRRESGPPWAGPPPDPTSAGASHFADAVGDGKLPARESVSRGAPGSS